MVNSRGARGGMSGRGRGRGNLPGQVNSSDNRVVTRSNNATSISTIPLSTDVGIVLCGFCSIVVGNDSIGCDKCSKWYHPTTQCTGLKSNTISCIQVEGGDTIKFVCSECRCQPRSRGQGRADSSISTSPVPQFSQETVGQLYEMIKSLAQSVTLLTKKFDESVNSSRFGNSLQNQPSSVAAASRDSLFAEFHEYEERKKRKESVIVRGIVAANETEFTTIFGRISLAISGRCIQPDQVVCINHQSNLYRIKIADHDTRRSILTNAKKLRDDDNYKNVFLSRDLTYLQRQEFRARRTASTGQNVGSSSNLNPNFMPVGSVQLPVGISEPSGDGEDLTNSSPQNL